MPVNALNVSLRLVLSALLVISTGGFATYAHLCKGAVVSTSIIIPKDPCSSGSCSMSDQQHSADEGVTCCSSHSDQHEARKHCCDDDFIFLQTTPVKDEEAQPQMALHLNQQVSFPVFAALAINSTEWRTVFLPVKRLFLLHQNFRL